MANLNPHFHESLIVNYLYLLVVVDNPREFSKYYDKVEDYIKSLICEGTEYAKLVELRSIICYKKALINGISKR